MNYGSLGRDNNNVDGNQVFGEQSRMEMQKAESFVNEVKVKRGQIMMVILHLRVIVCVWDKKEMRVCRRL